MNLEILVACDCPAVLELYIWTSQNMRKKSKYIRERDAHDQSPYPIFLLFLAQVFVDNEVMVVGVGYKRYPVVPQVFLLLHSRVDAVCDVDSERFEQSN